ncbi:cytochrome P450 family protein [Streptomyces fuscigenes]|uniref:cytochrome P450 family protein n=1 Tax=Streptomyces fuscigenes TaxID=1528880 RepID=UPI001F34ABC6|nr:cytochrome P450 [Streptomyces fuscigenes]MCF3963889.1 cytochrome P450 [Streptomyces fuscigenes]
MATFELADLGADFTADPYALYARMRELGPVHEVRGADGWRFWLIVGYEECRAAFGDPRLAKSSPFQDEEDRIMGRHVLISDPPDHTRLRRLVAKEFTPRRVAAMRPRVQEITDGLLDAMLPAGRADLVDALSFPLPITVICELLGVPHEDRDSFRAWSNDVVAPTDAERSRTSVLAMRDYLDALIARRRGAEPGDDLLSGLLRTEAEGEDRLSAEEVRAMAFILLVAGHETTVNLISNGVRALLQHPDQLAALRADPDLLDGAIEEMLRYDGPVENATFRFTTEPVLLGGTEIPAGEPVLVGLASADRDPRRFAEPDTFDIRRSAEGGAGHLAFGHGIHFCLGAPLARLEARIAIGSLLERAPKLALDEPDRAFDWVPGLLIRGTRHLPVRW